MHRARVETLVDGVFAIAMTILVLEVKVPDLVDRRSAEELLLALWHHGYVIAAYFFSFAMLAVFWVWHHRLAEKIRDIDFPLLVCIIVFLSLVCFFPFATALLGRYPLNLTALLVYVPLTGLIVLVQTLFYAIAIRRKLIDESVSTEAMLMAHRRNLLGCGIFVLASVPTLLRLDPFVALGGAVLGGLIFWRAKKLAHLPGKPIDAASKRNI